MLAFVELVAIGVALAVRGQSPRDPVVVERIVTEYIPVALTAATESRPEPAPAATETAADPAPAPAREPVRKPFTTEAEILATPSPAPSVTPVLKAPYIADPVVERLVQEAREARVKGNMGAAIAKLEDAQQTAPNEPNVLYQFAEIFEAVGNYDKAGDYYEKVLALGPQKSGSLLELAAHKLSHGFESARKMEGKLTLGRIRHFKDTRLKEGEKVVITVPVVAAPGHQIEPGNVTVDVFFFDEQDGDIKETIDTSKRTERWLTEPVDWQDTGEELLQVTYYIPPANERDLHLLGPRTYFGQVVELHYKDELLDHQAWPRTLANQRNVPESDPLFIPEEFIPQDLNEANPLLPPLPR